MVEENSRLSILVIEDNPEYGRNALQGLKGHNVVLAASLHAALDILVEMGNRRPLFDCIISDVHVPVDEGEEPRSLVSVLLNLAYGNEVPVCFVTRADHHGMLDLGDEGYVSLVAMDFSAISQSLLEKGRKEGMSEQELFRSLKSSARENLKTSSKSPEIWARALQMLQNCSARASPLAGAIRQVRSIGLDVGFGGLVPRVVPREDGRLKIRK